MSAATLQRPESVLFVCSMNAIRSPMAERLMRYYYPTIYSQSAGVHKGHLDPFAVLALEEIGLDMKKHTPRTLDEIEDSYFDLVISLAPEAHHRAMELTRTESVEVEYWPTLDPSVATGSRDQILDMYRAARDSLGKKIRARFS